ncbi:type II secretion system protein [Piscinibacter gummiphilus]|uniref:Type II secretion system protein n=1 Tax=Piscinibacter gummiphilus TaxID=946333 RepID=A0ABZ0CRU1_9BURK|nr:type II secretion system protein [Piscinibacter gummiphilus]WOB07236.1 type II secretion system protein [Piscinibacter gummiphilus]
MRRTTPLHHARGFTLLEAVLVIMLTGIVGVMVSTFVRQPIDAYVDLGRRAELTDAADLALRRMARELRTALPNSVRVDASGTYIEFLPVRSAGRYRAALSATNTGNTLDFGSTSDNSFDVLGPTVTAVAGDQLVVHNLGLPGADAYEGSSRRALTTFGTALASLGYTVGGTQFPYASPNQRFHIVGTPVSYGCAPVPGGAGSLRRYAGYAIQNVQPTSALASQSGANNALLTGWVAACSFTYTASATTRNAVVTLRLTLTSGGESINLLQQVQVEGSP